MDQLTAVFAEPVMVLVNACVAPRVTDAEAGATFTTTGTAVTATATVLPVCAPLPGCRTENCRVPGAVVVPLAIRLVGEA